MYVRWQKKKTTTHTYLRSRLHTIVYKIHVWCKCLQTNGKNQNQNLSSLLLIVYGKANKNKVRVWRKYIICTNIFLLSIYWLFFRFILLLSFFIGAKKCIWLANTPFQLSEYVYKRPIWFLSTLTVMCA